MASEVDVISDATRVLCVTGCCDEACMGKSGWRAITGKTVTFYHYMHFLVLCCENEGYVLSKTILSVHTTRTLGGHYSTVQQTNIVINLEKIYRKN